MQRHGLAYRMLADSVRSEYEARARTMAQAERRGLEEELLRARQVPTRRGQAGAGGVAQESCQLVTSSRRLTQEDFEAIAAM